MTLRVHAGKFLIKFGGFLQSLALSIMKPSDLMAFNQASYSENDITKGLSSQVYVLQGLNHLEQDLLEKTSIKNGRILVLGVGGGREAIQFGRLGYEVTGVDYVPELLDAARQNTKAQGIEIKLLLQNILELESTPNYYDIVWFGPGLYSEIPTRKRRVKFLRVIWEALQPEGCVVIQYLCDAHTQRNRWAELMRKGFAFLSFGNISYEQGDRLWANSSFVHVFQSTDQIQEEVFEAGFKIQCFANFRDTTFSGAILTK